MKFAILIAAAFIVATIAIATLSPFDNLPRPSQRQTTVAEPAADGSPPDEESSQESTEESSEESTEHESPSGDEAPPPEGEEPPP